MGTVLVVTGPDPTLPAQVRALIGAGASVVVCDVQAVTDPDLLVVDALLRLALTARRCGGYLRLVNVPPGLRDLLACTGLATAFGLGIDLGVAEGVADGEP